MTYRIITRKGTRKLINGHVEETWGKSYYLEKEYPTAHEANMDILKFANSHIPKRIYFKDGTYKQSLNVSAYGGSGVKVVCFSDGRVIEYSRSSYLLDSY